MPDTPRTTADHLAIRKYLKKKLDLAGYGKEGILDRALASGIINEDRVIEIIAEGYAETAAPAEAAERA